MKYAPFFSVGLLTMLAGILGLVFAPEHKLVFIALIIEGAVFITIKLVWIYRRRGKR